MGKNCAFDLKKMEECWAIESPKSPVVIPAAQKREHNDVIIAVLCQLETRALEVWLALAVFYFAVPCCLLFFCRKELLFRGTYERYTGWKLHGSEYGHWWSRLYVLYRISWFQSIFERRSQYNGRVCALMENFIDSDMKSSDGCEKLLTKLW